MNEGSFGPPGEAIDNGQDILVASTHWKRSYQINVEMRETVIEGQESLWCSVDIPLHFAVLTRKANQPPVLDIPVHVLPEYRWEIKRREVQAPG